jgi:hypothetical protein
VPGGEGGYQVVGWRCGALVQQPGEVGQHLQGGVVRGLDGSAVGVALAGEAAIERRDCPGKPVPVPGRDAEHVGDHDERQRPGEVCDQIHAARGDCQVDQRGGSLGDDGPVALDPAGCEQAPESVPDAAVPVAVQPHHPPGEQLERRIRGGQDRCCGEPRVAQHIPDEQVLAAGQGAGAQDDVRVGAADRREQST